MKRIVFFGNSLTAGYGLADPLKQSIPGLIAEKIKQLGADYEVHNYGVSGDTTTSAIKRLNHVLSLPIDLFVLELGANDFLQGTHAETIFNNLQYIIDQVRNRQPDSKILLLGLELPPWAVRSHSGNYNTIYKNLAEQNKLSLLPSFLKGVSGKRELNMFDGVHPLASGYEIAANNIWPVLKNLLLF